MEPITSGRTGDLAPRLGTEAALGLANSAHGPSAHYGRHARADAPPHDHLTTAGDAHAFLAGHAIPAPAAPPSPAQLERLRSIRGLIRALADAPRDDVETWRRRLDAALEPARFRLGADGAWRSDAAGWDAIADELLPAALLLAAERDRLRTCGNPGCRWLFVDRSPRGDRVWCEAAVCGNRVRVGRHRRRRLGTTGAERRAQPPR